MASAHFRDLTQVVNKVLANLEPGLNVKVLPYQIASNVTRVVVQLRRRNRLLRNSEVVDLSLCVSKALVLLEAALALYRKEYEPCMLAVRASLKACDNTLALFTGEAKQEAPRAKKRHQRKGR